MDKNTIKENIKSIIRNYIQKYEDNPNIKTKWREAVIKFGDARSKLYEELKNSVQSDHIMPTDVMEDAKVVIAYFIPFVGEISKSNDNSGLASEEWAIAYRETNKLFEILNEHISNYIKSLGYNASPAPKEATSLDKKIIKSHWSYRHIAKISGLGTFGINNLLITEKGSCGRINTVITNLDCVEIDEPIKEEYCLYKKNKSCTVCIDKCPCGALNVNSFDREKCYNLCLENAKVNGGSDICGKCAVELPCSFFEK